MAKNYNGENINEFLLKEELRIKSMLLHPANPTYNVSAGPEVKVLPPNVSRSGRDPEFPNGGDPRFRAVLAEMLRIHISKSNDYGTGKDIYANYRAAETIGVPAWQSCFIRALEKVKRLTNAFGGKKLNHEGISDSFIDLANHIVISKVLYDESQDQKCGNPDCDC